MQKAPREQTNFRYQEKLKDKFAQHPEVRRIAKHRYVPKHIKSGQKELETIKASQTRKYASPVDRLCASQLTFLFSFLFCAILGMLIVCCTASPERSTSECSKLKSKLFVKNHSVLLTTPTETLEKALREPICRCFASLMPLSFLMLLLLQKLGFFLICFILTVVNKTTSFFIFHNL